MTYNSRLKPASFAVPDVMSKSYDYYADGRLRFSQDLINAKFDRSYDYDHGGRVTAALSGAEARNEGASTLRPYKETFVYDALGHLTERPLNLLWSGAGGLFSPAQQEYQNERNVNWEYDAAGNLTNSGNVQYTLNAAQQTRRVISDTYLGWSPFSTISSVTTDLTQSFDGTGAAVKQEEVDVSHDDVQGDTTTATTTYLLRSSVLGGKIITEINAAGSKQRAFVYLGNEVLAWQRQVGNDQSVRWEHRDPHNGSFRLSTENGMLEQTSSSELDALGTNAGLHDPAPTAGDYKRMSAYPGFGNALMSSDTQCMVDSVMGPCSLAALTIASKAADTVTVRAGADVGIAWPGDTAVTMPIFSAVEVQDPDTHEPTPGNDVTTHEHHHYELVPNGLISVSLQLPQNPTPTPQTNPRQDFKNFLQTMSQDCKDALKGLPGNVLGKLSGLANTAQIYDVNNLQNARASTYVGAQAGRQTLGQYFDSRGHTAITVASGRHPGIYTRGGESVFAGSMYFELHEMTHLAFPRGGNLDFSLGKALGLTKGAKEDWSAAVSRFFNSKCTQKVP